MTLREYKSRFYRPNLDTEWVSLNNAGLQPISLDAKLELQYWAERFYKEGFLTDADYHRAVEATRAQVARLVGCEPSQVAFFASTAGGINQIAWQLPLKPDEEIVLLEQDYPSLIYPFDQASLRKGFHVKRVPNTSYDLKIDVEDIIQHFTKKTKVLAISWYQYQTGATCDFDSLLAEAKRRDIFVLIDGMQGLGIQPFSLWKKGLVDAVVGGSHKWLSSPVGVGFLAVREIWISKIPPHNVGSLTFGSCDEVAQLNCFIKKDATRFEPASRASAEIAALGKSIELILKVTPDVLLQEALRLTEILEAGLIDLGYKVQNPNPARCHSILNFSCSKKNVGELSAHLKQSRVLHAVRNNSIRLSPAAFNTDEEIEKVLECLKN